MRQAGLFEGYGGLSMAVAEVLGAELAWYSEIDPAASRLLAHHHPDVPNVGDVSAVDWTAVEPVDVLTGGFPCQDVSLAGRRAGIRPDTRSGLWTHMAYAIDQLRPGLVVIENVRGLLSADAACDLEPCPWCLGDDEGRPLRALGAVLGDLAELGYDARWCGLRAADVGAPHGRFRVFVVAWPAADAEDDRRTPLQPCGHEPQGPWVTGRWSAAADAGGDGRQGGEDRDLGQEGGQPTPLRGDPAGRVLGAAPAASDPPSGSDEDEPIGGAQEGQQVGALVGPGDRDCSGEAAAGVQGLGRASSELAWGPYEPAIRRRGVLDDLFGEGLRDEAARPRDVQEALHPLAGDRRSSNGQAGRPEASTSSGAVLGAGGQKRPDTGLSPRSGAMLDLDGIPSEQVGPWQVHARETERQGAPMGVRGAHRPDPRAVDAGSPVPGAGMREPGAPGTGDLGGERAAGERREDPLPAEPRADRAEPVPQPVRDASLSDVPERSEPQNAGEALGWGPYAPAIERWQAILGRPAPAPTQVGKRGGQQLSPRFVEWLMGLPEGHVTAVPGLTRNEQLGRLGNGVVPQQAAAALRYLLAVS